eukprot:4887240-Ditylum_brightwellii.AAC.1
MRVLYFTSQKEGMTLEQYLDEFQNQREIVEECGGNAGDHPGLNGIVLEEAGFDLDDPASISVDDRKTAERDAKEAYLAFVFLSNANKVKFALLLQELANAHLQENDDYPHTITAAHNDGITYTTLADEDEEEEVDEEGNVLVNTSSEKGKVIRSKCDDIIKCYLCGINHYASVCDQKKDDDGDKRKKGHLHLTTNKYDENDKDKDYGDWGSISISRSMFHQHGLIRKKSYKQALTKTAKAGPNKTLIPSAPPNKWSQAKNHLLQQSRMKGKLI